MRLVHNVSPPKSCRLVQPRGCSGRRRLIELLSPETHSELLAARALQA